MCKISRKYTKEKYRRKVLGELLLTHPVYRLNCHVCVLFAFFTRITLYGRHVLIKFLIQMTTSRTLCSQYFTMIVYSNNCHARFPLLFLTVRIACGPDIRAFSDCSSYNCTVFHMFAAFIACTAISDTPDILLCALPPYLYIFTASSFFHITWSGGLAATLIYIDVFTCVLKTHCQACYPQ